MVLCAQEAPPSLGVISGDLWGQDYPHTRVAAITACNLNVGYMISQRDLDTRKKSRLLGPAASVGSGCLE